MANGDMTYGGAVEMAHVYILLHTCRIYRWV